MTAPATAHWKLLLAAGIAFAGDLAVWHTSIKLTSVANSTLLANLASIFVTLAAWLLWKQRPRGLFLAGLATALAGVGMLVQTSATLSATALGGDALGVVTAMFYAWYLLLVKQLRDGGAATLRLMATTTTITAVLLLPVALASGEQMMPVTARGWLTLAGLALVSHAAGQGLITYALAPCLPGSCSASRSRRCRSRAASWSCSGSTSRAGARARRRRSRAARPVAARCGRSRTLSLLRPGAARWPARRRRRRRRRRARCRS